MEEFIIKKENSSLENQTETKEHFASFKLKSTILYSLTYKHHFDLQHRI